MSEEPKTTTSHRPYLAARLLPALLLLAWAKREVEELDEMMNNVTIYEFAAMPDCFQRYWHEWTIGGHFQI